MGIYFSVDYRSPPSGFGQIVRSEQDSAKQMTLIAFKGCGQRDDPSYKETYFINTENWRQIVIQTYHSLKQHGVEEVYDSELYCDYPDQVNPQTYKFKLEDWYRIQLGE